MHLGLKYFLYTIPSLLLSAELLVSIFFDLTQTRQFIVVANIGQFIGGLFFAIGYILQLTKMRSENDLNIFSVGSLAYACYLYEWFALEKHEMVPVFVITNTMCLIFSFAMFIMTLTTRDMALEVLALTIMFVSALFIPVAVKINGAFWNVSRLTMIASIFILFSYLFSFYNILRGRTKAYSLFNGSIVFFVLIMYLHYAVVIDDLEFVISQAVLLIAVLVNNAMFVFMKLHQESQTCNKFIETI